MPQIIRKAFTLIELLVVIAIIGILSGLIVVSMGGVTQKATIAKAQVFSNSLRNSLMLDMISEWKLDGGIIESVVTTADILDTWSTNNAVGIASSPIIKGGSNCVSGNCIQFDGIDDYVSFGNIPAFSMGLKDHTVSIWAKFDNALAPQNETLIKGGAGGAGIKGYIIWRATGTSRLALYFNDGSVQVSNTLSSVGSLINDNWYNIVVTFNRDGVAEAYINGTKQSGILNLVPYQLVDIQNGSTLTIGAYSNSLFAGKIDEVRIYNAIPTTSQIKEQYYAGLNKLLVNGGITEEEYLYRLKDYASNN
jgi:prepilin-type N-terminal cleavage/methylation domain-containing protein